MDVHTLDYHTGGEPLRIVTGGFPELQGESMLERRRHLQREFDHLRRFLMLEPRGHADMYGAVLTPPATADGDIGVLFMHNAGYSTMCGHGIIAIVTAGLEQGLFPVNDPKDIRIDSPAGRILARANPDREGKLESVTFRNVASFVMRPAERSNQVPSATFPSARPAAMRAAFSVEKVPAERFLPEGSRYMPMYRTPWRLVCFS